MTSFILLVGFLGFGILSGALLRRRGAAGTTVAFACFVVLLVHTGFIDGTSSGFISAGTGWIMVSWLLQNMRHSPAGERPLKARVTFIILLIVWLYTTLEWHGSPHARALQETGSLHSNAALSNIALASGLTLVLVAFGYMQGILADADERFLLFFGINAALFGIAFCLDAGDLISFSIRHGDSTAWVVPLSDYLFSWAYTYSVLLFSAYVLWSLGRVGLFRGRNMK